MREGDTFAANAILNMNDGTITNCLSIGSTGKITFSTGGGMTTSVRVSTNHVLFPVFATTGSPPAYVNGGLYFATDTDKLYVGGAAGWEAVTSA